MSGSTCEAWSRVRPQICIASPGQQERASLHKYFSTISFISRVTNKSWILESFGESFQWEMRSSSLA